MKQSLNISRWNTSKVQDMSYTFAGCNAMDTIVLDGWSTESVITTESMFENCYELQVLNLDHINNSNNTSMYKMFKNCYALNYLNVSFSTINVLDISECFEGCSGLTQLNLSTWDINEITNTNSTFVGCINVVESLGKTQDDCDRLNASFNKPSNVVFQAKARVYGTNKDSSTFDQTFANETDLKAYITAGVTTMDSITVETPTGFMTDCSNMFSGSQATSIVLSDMETNSVSNMSNMFYECTNLQSLDLSGCDASNVTNTTNMFYVCNMLTESWARTQADADKFNTSSNKPSNVVFEVNYPITIIGTTTSDQPINTGVETEAELKSWVSINKTTLKTLKVTAGLGVIQNCHSLFSGCSSLTSLDLSNFNTSQVTDMNAMFYNCSSLTSLDLSSFNTSKTRIMYAMFADCSSLTSLDLSSFDTSNVYTMIAMFANCSSLTSLDLSNFNTSQVTDMEQLFSGCSSLTSLDLSSFDTSSTTDISTMFAYCSSLTSLDLSSFDTSNIDITVSMFQNCSSLTNVYARLQADVDKFNASSNKPSNVVVSVKYFVDITPAPSGSDPFTELAPSYYKDSYGVLHSGTLDLRNISVSPMTGYGSLSIINSPFTGEHIIVKSELSEIGTIYRKYEVNGDITVYASISMENNGMTPNERIVLAFAHITV